jgi:hypothetical protein
VAATDRLRAAMKVERGPVKPFDYGPERDCWDAVFDDHSMVRFNALLMRLPLSARTQRRRDIFERVIPELAHVGVRPLNEVIGDVAAARVRFAAELEHLAAELD